MSGRPDLRKGWCPGALRPMSARDGLLVRLKITGGIVPATVALAIADLAERHGNALLDLSARANLQLRGVREEALPSLWEGLGELGLLDEDAAAEAVRNVLASPLAGLGRRPSSTDEDAPDIRPVVTDLEHALVADPTLRVLPSKFGLLVDDGGAPSLANVAADLRFDWVAGQRAFAVGLGGTAAEALSVGFVGADAIVARAIALAHRCLAWPSGPRRVGAMIREIGREATATWFGARVPALTPRPAYPQVVGHRTFGSVATLGLAVPFGRLDAAMLRAAAHLAAAAGVGELRLTPWRTILVPHVVPDVDLTELANAGFIVDPDDPRLRMAACTGQSGCERGSTDTHADATALADVAAALPGDGVTLHLSGCAKGCAHPSRATFTLVGRDGRYDLVRNARPGDEPALRSLDVAAIRAAFSASSTAYPR